MKVLFIGLGSIGQRHLRNLLELAFEPVELMAVRRAKTVPLLTENMTLDESGLSVTEKYSIQEFSELENALMQHPDIVFVTNPTCFHAADALAAVKSGAAVFIEKPLGADWLGIPELIQAVEESPGALAMVGYQFRFNPALQKIKMLLDSSCIGRIVSAKFINGEYMPYWHPYEDYRIGYGANKKLGGGALVNQIHEFDLAYWFFGMPKTVYAIGGHLSRLAVDVEDSVISLMGFEDKGKVFPVSIALDYLRYPPERSLTIVGDKGVIIWNTQVSQITVSDTENRKVSTFDFSSFDRNHMFITQLQCFLGTLAGGSMKPGVSVKEAAQSLKMALAAKQSMASGLPVVMTNFSPKGTSSTRSVP